MKNSILIAFFAFSFSAYSQISFFTENPLGVFSIDPAQNNPTGTITSSLIYDDFIVDVDNSNQDAIVGVGAMPSNRAQLKLGNPNMAILLNNVDLQSTSSTVISDPQEGMIVYNTQTIAGPNPVKKALYVYHENQWQSVVQKKSLRSRCQIMRLQSDVETPRGTLGDISTAATLDFGNLEIQHDGTYIFIINLVATTPYYPSGRTPGKYCAYLEQNSMVADQQAFNVSVAAGINKTYTISLSANLNKGDNVTLKINTDAGSPVWNLISSTTATGDTTLLNFWTL